MRNAKARTGLYAVGVCGAAAMLLAGCGNASAPLPERWAQAPPDRPIAVAPVDREVHELTGFLSPSRNIGCMIAPAGVGCDILERSWSPPPRPADCRWDYGRIFVGPGKPAHFVCAGDSAYDGSAPPLAYGETITAGSIRCDSAASGITCRDVESGHGFSISREAYRIF